MTIKVIPASPYDRLARELSEKLGVELISPDQPDFVPDWWVLYFDMTGGTSPTAQNIPFNNIVDTENLVRLTALWYPDRVEHDMGAYVDTARHIYGEWMR